MPLVHEELRERLRGMIGGRWKPGDKLPPIKELAVDLNAGHVNTHRAVKQLVGEGLLLSRPRRGTIVNPRFGSMQSDLSILSGKSIGVICRINDQEAFLRPAIAELEEAISAFGSSCQVIRHPEEDFAISSHSDFDLLIVVNPHYRLMLKANKGQPMLVLTTCLDHRLGMADGYDIVSVDSEQGGHLAGRHLQERGITRALFIGCGNVQGQTLDITSQCRLRGFLQGLQQSAERVSTLVVEDYRSHEGAKAVSEFLQLDPRPEAVFCASDDIAMGFAHGAIAHGLTLGKDVQLIGFDGQTRGRKLLVGGISTIDIPAVTMGRVAANHIRRRLQLPDSPVRRVQLACSLFQGATTSQA